MKNKGVHTVISHEDLITLSNFVNRELGGGCSSASDVIRKLALIIKIARGNVNAEEIQKIRTQKLVEKMEKIKSEIDELLLILGGEYETKEFGAGESPSVDRDSSEQV